MTLPAIIAMDRFPGDNAIRDLFQHPKEETHLRRAVELIQDSSVIDESHQVAKQFADRALNALKTLPRWPTRDSLEELVTYVLARRT
jgi:all-trans-nonaprenyl-diphosphate synthase